MPSMYVDGGVLCLDTRGAHDSHDSEISALHTGSIFTELKDDTVDTCKRNTDNNQIQSEILPAHSQSDDVFC